MSRQNGTRHETAFTTSIEAREGVTTGISAGDRARTVAVAIDAGKSRDDIVTPGHIFPLIARDGGVLVRAGHTEASVDRKSAVSGKSVSVRVELGGRWIIKKKEKNADTHRITCKHALLI